MPIFPTANQPHLSLVNSNLYNWKNGWDSPFLDRIRRDLVM